MHTKQIVLDRTGDEVCWMWLASGESWPRNLLLTDSTRESRLPFSWTYCHWTMCSPLLREPVMCVFFSSGRFPFRYSRAETNYAVAEIIRQRRHCCHRTYFRRFCYDDYWSVTLGVKMTISQYGIVTDLCLSWR